MWGKKQARTAVDRGDATSTRTVGKVSFSAVEAWAVAHGVPENSFDNPGADSAR